MQYDSLIKADDSYYKNKQTKTQHNPEQRHGKERSSNKEFYLMQKNKIHSFLVPKYGTKSTKQKFSQQRI